MRQSEERLDDVKVSSHWDLVRLHEERQNLVLNLALMYHKGSGER